jgi:hypothetical protein
MVVPPHALAAAAAAAESVVVLHSTSDPVLHFAFPPGQTAAGPGEGLLPTAWADSVRRRAWPAASSRIA